MIPNLTDWKRWTALERASYVAQLATAAAFLGSSVLSFLSWREAAASREEQREFFISEKAPNVEITKIEISRDEGVPKIIYVYMKNHGSSTAKNLKARLQMTPELGRFEIKSHAQCDYETIEKDRTASCRIYVDKYVFMTKGDEDRSITAFLVSDDTPYNNDQSVHRLVIDYTGIFNDEHQSDGWIVFTLGKKHEPIPTMRMPE